MSRNSRFVAIMLSLFVSATWSTASFANSSSSIGNNFGEGSTPFTALAGTPEANLFNGAVSTSVRIQVPPGRKSMTPDLALSYSSSAGPSPYGYGWSFPIGGIQRSTKWGVPRCGGAHSDEFVLMMPGGVNAELMAESGGGVVYRPKVEEAFVEAKAFKGTGSGNYWVVRDRAGLKYTFGSTPDARVFKAADKFYNSTASTCEFTTMWKLTKIENANGSWIEINWDKQGNIPVPSNISYGGSTGGNGVSHFYHIDFEYEDLPSRRYSHMHGVREYVDRRLKAIEVSTDIPNVGTEIRTYELAHWTDPVRWLELSNVMVTKGGLKLDSYPEQSFYYMPHDLGHQAPGQHVSIDATTGLSSLYSSEGNRLGDPDGYERRRDYRFGRSR